METKKDTTQSPFGLIALTLGVGLVGVWVFLMGDRVPPLSGWMGFVLGGMRLAVGIAVARKIFNLGIELICLKSAKAASEDKILGGNEANVARVKNFQKDDAPNGRKGKTYRYLLTRAEVLLTIVLLVVALNLIIKLIP